MRPNVYYINELDIEFVNTYYRPLEFLRRDPVTYIKLKDQNRWLYENNNQLKFTSVQPDTFYPYKQPYTLWLNYLGQNTFIIYKMLGSGLNSVMGHISDRQSNIVYLHYAQDNDKITIEWTKNILLATRFIYDNITWNDFLVAS